MTSALQRHIGSLEDEIRDQREASVSALADTSQKLNLAEAQAQWLAALLDAREWRLLQAVRHLVTHRATESYTQIGPAGPPRTGLRPTGLPPDLVKGTSFKGPELAGTFARFSGEQFRLFCEAVLTDYPERDDHGGE